MDPGYVCYSNFCDAEIYRSDDKSTTPETVDLNRLEIVIYNDFFDKKLQFCNVKKCVRDIASTTNETCEKLTYC
jgi:hypothetical protein